MMKFGITGVGGFVAPRHLKAIHDTNNTLVCALDPNDSVGILDEYFPEADFFTSDIRFERYLEKMRLDNDANAIDYLSVCSPNYIHDSHIRMGLRAGANVISEKPMVISPWNLDILAQIEAETGKRVYTVLQLRHHAGLCELKKRLDTEQNRKRVDVTLQYITRRGRWYHISWKGKDEESGGLAMNIGVHFFDLLIWLFGHVEHSELYLAEKDKMAGKLELEWATVRWFLSIDRDDLPTEAKARGTVAFRSITIDGEEVDFSGGFTDLHTMVYQQVLRGDGFGIEVARPSIELIHHLRHSELVASSQRHPFLTT